ncbi:hypothetical protein [Crossiella sp. NPDC003009]
MPALESPVRQGGWAAGHLLYAPASRQPIPPRPRSTVHITIGRVEVRAEQPAPNPKRGKTSRPAVLELDDYLRTRKGG